MEEPRPPISDAEILAYSPDSPLFYKRANESAAEILILADFLKSITKQMKLMCKDLKHTARAGDALSVLMKSGGVGGASKAVSQIMPVIKHFGEIFSEIATSQEILAECMENAFIRPLEAFSNNDVSKVSQLHQQYRKERGTNEEALIKYLQSDVVGAFGRASTQSTLDVRALEVVQQRKRLEMTRLDLINGINDVKMRRNFEIAEACVSALYALKTHHRECNERLQSSSSLTNDFGTQQQRDRNNFKTTKGPQERLRGDVFSVLTTMVERVQLQTATTTIATDGGSSSGNHGAGNDAGGGGGGSGGGGEDNNVVAAAASKALGRLGNILAKGAGGAVEGANFIRRHALSNAGGDGGDSASAAGASGGQNSNGNSSSSLSVQEVETRMKALDRSELESLFTRHVLEEYPGVVKQGYLLEKVPSKMMQQTSWTRQWFVVDESRLYFIKERDSISSPLEVQVVCDTMLAAVREIRSPEVPYTFEIAYANLRTFTLQAEGPKEYTAWIDAIRSAIERRLASGAHASSPMSLDSLSGGDGGSSSRADMQAVVSRRKEMVGIVNEILTRNKTCAECGKADPDWLSLNLGCLICIDCSGVHRSLGVHISKVRSITLDDLEPEEYQFLLRAGNTISNSIWEANVPPDVVRPQPTDNYVTRDKFIRAKYQSKSFLGPGDLGDELMSSTTDTNATAVTTEEVGEWAGGERGERERGEGEWSSSTGQDKVDSPPLSVACKDDDIEAALRAIAFGADVGAAQFVTASSQRASSPVPVTSSKTPLMRPSPLHVAAENGSLACAVLLLQNGADIAATVNKYVEPSNSGESSSSTTSSTSATVAVALTAEALASKAGHELLASYLRRKSDLMRSGRPPPAAATTSVIGGGGVSLISSAAAATATAPLTSESSQDDVLEALSNLAIASSSASAATTIGLGGVLENSSSLKTSSSFYSGRPLTPSVLSRFDDEELEYDVAPVHTRIRSASTSASASSPDEPVTGRSRSASRPNASLATLAECEHSEATGGGDAVVVDFRDDGQKHEEDAEELHEEEVEVELRGASSSSNSSRPAGAASSGSFPRGTSSFSAIRQGLAANVTVTLPSSSDISHKMMKPFKALKGEFQSVEEAAEANVDKLKATMGKVFGSFVSGGSSSSSGGGGGSSGGPSGKKK